MRRIPKRDKPLDPSGPYSAGLVCRNRQPPRVSFGSHLRCLPFDRFDHPRHVHIYSDRSCQPEPTSLASSPSNPSLENSRSVPCASCEFCRSVGGNAGNRSIWPPAASRVPCGGPARFAHSSGWFCARPTPPIWVIKTRACHTAPTNEGTRRVAAIQMCLMSHPVQRCFCGENSPRFSIRRKSRFDQHAILRAFVRSGFRDSTASLLSSVRARPGSPSPAEHPQVLDTARAGGSRLGMIVGLAGGTHLAEPHGHRLALELAVREDVKLTLATGKKQSYPKTVVSGRRR